MWKVWKLWIKFCRREQRGKTAAFRRPSEKSFPQGKQKYPQVEKPDSRDNLWKLWTIIFSEDFRRFHAH
ncbi:MAG: hypothetical protein K2G28_07350, partial [Acetatifactor sp.]|nr:hypothetical protein [Acetatifactor sp.]